MSNNTSKLSSSLPKTLIVNAALILLFLFIAMIIAVSCIKYPYGYNGETILSHCLSTCGL